MTLWSGRVGGSLDPSVWAFLHADDAELLPYDCEASVRHAQRLHGAGLLSDEELAAVEARLAEIAHDPAGYLDEDEDVHSAIERQLGDLGRKIHAGRSRNDQVAAAFRLYVLDACAQAREEIDALALVVLSFAEAEADTLMPGYTHLQRGQPVTLGHHLLAWVEMLDRDRTRFAAAAAAALESPLGAGALAGSTLGLKGPPGQMRNSIDAVADRDFALDYLYAVAVLYTHLSRIGEEIVLWCVGRVRLREAAGERGDGVVDDAAEAEPGRRRARARQGGNGDRPADRPARDRQGASARLRPRPAGGQGARLRGAHRHATRAAGARRARSPASVSTGSGWRPLPPTRSVLATDAAEALVLDGVPFREAHERVAASVRDGSFTPAGTAAESVAARGAPGPGGVREALAEARSRFGETR